VESSITFPVGDYEFGAGSSKYLTLQKLAAIKLFTWKRTTVFTIRNCGSVRFPGVVSNGTGALEKPIKNIIFIRL
jgi:hypothetical protein